MEKLMTINEVALILRCSVKTVRRYVKDGLIVYSVGRKLLFKAQDVEKYLEEGKHGR